MGRSIEDETRLLDEIIGRCVRDPDFGHRVLLDPKATLAEYDASEGIVDDFRALAQHRDEALRDWLRLKQIVYKT